MQTVLQKIRACLPKNTSLVLWTVLLPLAVALFAGWEHRQFADHGPQEITAGDQARIDELQGILGRVENDRYATLEINGKRYGNPLASQKLRAAIADLRGEDVAPTPAIVVSLVRPAIEVAMTAGIAATLFGLLGLALVHLAGLRAMQSRDELMRVFALWRANLPLYLGVMLVMQMVAIGALTVVRGYVVYATEHASRGEMKGNLALLLLALALVWSGLHTLWRLRGSLRALDVEPSQVLGRAVTPKEAPLLWRYVADMAGRVGAAVPAHIVVGVGDGFYVTAQEIVLQPTGQRLSGETMYLPLTYLAMLRRDEVDAIVAHELGHFAGDDTRYSLSFSPIYRGMGNSLEVMQGDDESNQWGSIPAISFTAYLLQRFDHAVMHWSRIREFAADQTGARLAGAATVARALIRMTALNTAVRDVIAGVARRPDEAGHDLIEMLRQALQAHGLARPDFSHEVNTAHPSDTHPPTLERLQALGHPLSEPLLQAALAPVDGSALDAVRALFSDSQSLQSTLLSDFKAAAREHNHEMKQHLSALAEQAVASIEFHERRTMLWICSALGGVCLLIFALLGAMWLTSSTSRSQDIGLTILAALAGSAVFGGLGCWAWKRSSRMTFAMAPEGLHVPGLPQLLSWGHVGDCSLTENNAVALTLALNEQAPELLLQHSNYGRVSYNKKKRQLSISMFGVRGMKNSAFFELVSNYVTAWHARQQLNDM